MPCQWPENWTYRVQRGLTTRARRNTQTPTSEEAQALKIMGVWLAMVRRRSQHLQRHREGWDTVSEEQAKRVGSSCQVIRMRYKHRRKVTQKMPIWDPKSSPIITMANRTTRWCTLTSSPLSDLSSPTTGSCITKTTLFKVMKFFPLVLCNNPNSFQVVLQWEPSEAWEELETRKDWLMLTPIGYWCIISKRQAAKACRLPTTTPEGWPARPRLGTPSWAE